MSTMLLAILATATGMAIGLQARTAIAIHRHLRIPPGELEELAYRLRHQERQRESLEATVYALRARLTEYEVASSERQTQLAALSGQLQTWKAHAGLTDLIGPGVIVELDDSARPLRPGEDPNEVILHNYDVLAVLNDLWVAGAEAVALNGQRIIPTTPIRSMAKTLMVNTTRITPPLRITAIGEPDHLAAHLLRADGYVALLQSYRFPVTVRRTAGLVIPAYRGPLRFERVRSIPSAP